MPACSAGFCNALPIKKLFGDPACWTTLGVSRPCFCDSKRGTCMHMLCTGKKCLFARGGFVGMLHPSVGSPQGSNTAGPAPRHTRVGWAAVQQGVGPGIWQMGWASPFWVPSHQLVCFKLRLFNWRCIDICTPHWTESTRRAEPPHRCLRLQRSVASSQPEALWAIRVNLENDDHCTLLSGRPALGCGSRGKWRQNQRGQWRWLQHVRRDTVLSGLA